MIDVSHPLIAAHYNTVVLTVYFSLFSIVYLDTVQRHVQFSIIIPPCRLCVEKLLKMELNTDPI